MKSKCLNAKNSLSIKFEVLSFFKYIGIYKIGSSPTCLSRQTGIESIRNQPACRQTGCLN